MKWIEIAVLASLAINAILLAFTAADHDARIVKLENAAAVSSVSRVTATNNGSVPPEVRAARVP